MEPAAEQEQEQEKQEETWLRKLLVAFKRCQKELEDCGGLDLEDYVNAACLIQDAFHYLGTVFEFAKSDLVNKEAQLRKSCEDEKPARLTIREAVTTDFNEGRPKAGSSNSRTVMRTPTTTTTTTWRLVQSFSIASQLPFHPHSLPPRYKIPRTET